MNFSNVSFEAIKKTYVAFKIVYCLSMLNYSDWFLNVKQIFHSSKTLFSDDIFKLLGLVCYHCVKDFWVCVHYTYCFVVCFFTLCNIFVNFGIRVISIYILDYKTSCGISFFSVFHKKSLWGLFYSLSFIFWKISYKLGTISSFIVN